MTTLVDCPQSDRAQWSFRLFGTPVRVKFWFWIALVILCGERDLADVLIWVGVCFVSILLHEMGHVFAFRFFRRRAEVVLYGFGGMAIPKADVDGAWPRVAVALAGPFAGFCLAAIAIAAVTLTGGHLFWGRRLFLPHVGAILNYRLIMATKSVKAYLHLSVLANDLLFVNFFWGLVNLLPVWPLDGGHAARALLERWDAYDGHRKSLIVSVVIGAVVALGGILNQNTYLAVMFGLFAISSLQKLESARPRFRPYSWRG